MLFLNIEEAAPGNQKLGITFKTVATEVHSSCSQVGKQGSFPKFQSRRRHNFGYDISLESIHQIESLRWQETQKTHLRT
jgi:hypothetical protein